MAEYKLSELFEEVKINLGDDEQPVWFRLRDRTRSLGEKVDLLQDRFQGLSEDAPDSEAAELMIELVDALLEPLGDGHNGTRTHAKTLLGKQYKEDRIGSDRVIFIANFCQRKWQERMDPPSARQNDD